MRLAYSSPPITYGVRPEAAKPQTTSCSVNPIFSKSSLASSWESSAPSIAFCNAFGPPAIIPCTSVDETP